MRAGLLGVEQMGSCAFACHCVFENASLEYRVARRTKTQKSCSRVNGPRATFPEAEDAP
jgi:hypothetical protein